MTTARVSRVAAFILVLNSLLILASSYEVPDVKFQALKPKGFRVSIPDAPDLSLFVFQGNVNRPIAGNDVGSLTGEVTQPTDGRWVYEDSTTQLKEGDQINYYVFVSVNSVGYLKDNLKFKVRVLEDSSTGLMTHKPDIPADCKPTPTLVRGAVACAGQTIFEDHFDYLKEDVWQIEQYVALEHPEFPFISYQLPTVSIVDGNLKISPKLQQDMEGFNNESIYSGELNLFRGCTASANECSTRASGASILPPVASGRVTSKGLAFTYGTVQVRAKLPKGDWLYPEILLEPFRKKYGNGFASGVLKIACARGNSELFFGVTDHGNKMLYGGPVMDHQCLRYLIQQKELRNGKSWGDDFHVYSVDWTPDQIRLLVDGEEWAKIKPAKKGLVDRFPAVCRYLPRDILGMASKMAPFDDYFYITLGVAAGGITEFQDNHFSADGSPKPWKNSERKASLKFWHAINSWNPTWTTPDLLVDYVKVIAL